MLCTFDISKLPGYQKGSPFVGIATICPITCGDTDCARRDAARKNMSTTLSQGNVQLKKAIAQAQKGLSKNQTKQLNDTLHNAQGQLSVSPSPIHCHHTLALNP